MKKNNILAVIFICLSLHSNAFSEQGEWEKEPGYIREKISQLFIDPEDGNNLFIGTENTIYILDIAGKKFNPSLIAGGSELNVYAFEFIPGPVAQILAATDKGLYSSQDKGRSWQKQSYASDPQSQRCFSLFYDHKSQHLYVGTANGLYIRKTANGNFVKENGIAPDQPVYKILHDHDFFYFVTSQEVIRRGVLNHGSIETIYRLSNKEGEGDENLEKTFYLPRIKEFVVSPQKDSLFMVVLPHGILKSGDSGRQWQEFPSLGVPVRDINQLVFCPVCQHRGNPARSPQCTLLMCAATKKGVYTFQDTEWVGFNKGIATQEITALTVDSKGVIYAATDAGIYSNPELPLLMRNEAFYYAQDDLSRNAHPQKIDSLIESSSSGDFNKALYADYSRCVEQEPTIQEVHRMVIEYADVGPEKIEDWKGKSRMKSLLPSISVGIDRVGTNLFHWNTATEPDELQKGREYLGWDVSLSWDFSDLIWSSDQTSIDSRAKLMVELREDLLSQVTRIYFERRRIQMEIFNKSPLSAEEGSSFEHELRLAELTAIIDAMTGGMFSKRIPQYTR